MKTPITTTPTKYMVTQKTESTTRNIALDGVKALKAENLTTTFEVKYELNPKTGKPYKVVSKNQIYVVVEPMTFDLVEVTATELDIYRKNRIPSFVLKVDGKLYYTSIPKNLNFITSTILGAHRCAIVGRECNHLSAEIDELGGCAKVRDRSQCIERYSWILTGYETFNTNHDSFIVVCCSHYEKCPPCKKLSTMELNNKRLGLAQFVWDTVKTREEVQKRVEANLKNGITY